MEVARISGFFDIPTVTYITEYSEPLSRFAIRATLYSNHLTTRRIPGKVEFVFVLRRLLKGLTQPKRISEVFRARALTRDWLRLLRAYLGFPVRLPFRIALPSGSFEFRQANDAATFWQVFVREIYPVRPTDKAIVDAGANIGSFTLFALLRAQDSHVIAIEPAPDSCERIRSMLREHGLAERCSLHQVALAKDKGMTRMSLHPPSHVRTTGAGEIAVTAISLEELLTPYQKLDLLKIDTEGAEYVVLPNSSDALLQKIDRIEMEYHPGGDPQLLFRYLGERGFTLLAHQDDGGGYGMARLRRDSAESNLARTQAFSG